MSSTPPIHGNFTSASGRRKAGGGGGKRAGDLNLECPKPKCLDCQAIADCKICVKGKDAILAKHQLQKSTATPIAAMGDFAMKREKDGVVPAGCGLWNWRMEEVTSHQRVDR